MQTGGKQDDEAADEAFLRTLIRPEEDRRCITTAPWTGGFRWFRSANVVPLEQYQRRKAWEHDVV
jgi:hypothetical protein